MKKQIKLLIVEDSTVQLEFLLHLFFAYPEIKIIGVAHNGYEAIVAVRNLKPDVAIMDLHMPKMNGIEAIKEIMATNPLPIIAMSASNNYDEVINAFYAMEAGAVAFVEKPINPRHPHFKELETNLLQTIKLMSEVKVIHRFAKIIRENKPAKINTPRGIDAKHINLIAIGASTGGPNVLQTIFSNLSTDFPAILVVQHIAPGFVHELARWLSQKTNLPITVAQNAQIPQRGHIYFAPDNLHLGIKLIHHNIYIELKSNKNDSSLCPSVAYLFNTVSSVLKNKAMGILLTGMGADGAKELKQMKDQGAITIAQNKESSLIFGMPGQAIHLNAATYQLGPEEIAATISALSLTGVHHD